jgi:hypothetical protein
MNMPLPWQQRPMEVANLFNPAYLSVLINQVSAGYYSKTEEELPYAISFIALPLVIHPASVALLPKTAAAKLHIWLQEHPEVIFGFAERAKNLAPYVRESISFGVTHNVLSLTEGARIRAQPLKSLKRWEGGGIPLNSVKMSNLVGKLLGQVQDIPSSFSMFGVRP